MNTMRKFKLIVLLIVLGIFSTGCLDWWPEFGIPAGEQPWGEWNPIQGMHDSPAVKDQEAGMRYTPPGTLPLGFNPYPFGAADAAEASTVKNPVPPTRDTLRYGKLMYETNCVVCHGESGEGNGYIVPAYPMPPSLSSQRVRDWTDGEIFHVITHGQGRMWGYKSQLKVEERWAAVNYVRALQRAQYPEPEDLDRVSE